MSGKTVSSAILLLILGNALALVSDAIIKLQGSDVPVFQFLFVRTLCTLFLLLPLATQINRKQLAEGATIHLIRAHVSLIGVVCMVIALNTLPLATANALFYSQPLLVMILAVIFFRERLSNITLLAVCAGFMGILLILRPVELSWASLSALGAAFCLALNIVLIRKLPVRQPIVHTLLLTHLYMLPLGLVMMFWEGEAFQWGLVANAFGSSFFVLCYNLAILRAYRWVGASEITSAEYTGLILAIVVGWFFFGETLNVWFILGAMLIITPLAWMTIQDRRDAKLSMTSVHFQ